MNLRGSLLTVARKKATAHLSWALLAVSAVALTNSCSEVKNSEDSADDDDGEKCSKGDEGCPCYGNKTCNDGLTCLSNICVDATQVDDVNNEPSAENEGGAAPADTEAPANTDDNTAPAQDDPAENDDPADDPVSDEVTADDPAENDDPADDPVADETTSDTDETPPDDTTGEDTDTTPPDPSDTTPPSNTTPPSSCMPMGLCSEGGATDCEGDTPIERDCSACALLYACGTSCCASIGYFAATELPEYQEKPALISDFVQDNLGAALDLNFTGDGDFGAISFKLSEALELNPFTFTLDLSPGGEGWGYVSMSLETSDGESGCTYSMSFSGPGYTASGIGPEYCWGAWELSGQGATQQINVRLHSTVLGGIAWLRVNGIDWY